MLEIRDRILKQLHDERENLARVVLTGSLSPDDYRQQTGQLKGLDRSAEVVRDAFARYTEDDDDGDDSFPV